jgi:hypothetical protein
MIMTMWHVPAMIPSAILQHQLANLGVQRLDVDFQYRRVGVAAASAAPSSSCSSDWDAPPSGLTHYGMPKLLEKGSFEDSDTKFYTGGDNQKIHRFSFQYWTQCFASNEASIKFFDRDVADKLVSSDFLPTEFEGLPGQWLKFYAGKFEAGESLDIGPVVFTGSCERID